jgi:hypothetical protein
MTSQQLGIEVPEHFSASSSFYSSARCNKGADVRPDYHWDKEAVRQTGFRACRGTDDPGRRIIIESDFVPPLDIVLVIDNRASSYSNAGAEPSLPGEPEFCRFHPFLGTIKHEPLWFVTRAGRVVEQVEEKNASRFHLVRRSICRLSCGFVSAD